MARGSSQTGPFGPPWASLLERAPSADPFGPHANSDPLGPGRDTMMPATGLRAAPASIRDSAVGEGVADSSTRR
jgi:hypothetical protein